MTRFARALEAFAWPGPWLPASKTAIMAYALFANFEFEQNRAGIMVMVMAYVIMWVLVYS